MAAHSLTGALALTGVRSNRALCASRVRGAGGDCFSSASWGRLELRGGGSSCKGRRAVAMGMRNRRDRNEYSIGAMAGPGSTLEKDEKKKLPENYMEDMQEFLKKDLVHLFDEQGIDKTMYDPKVDFRDPVTNYDTLDGYLFNIGMLRTLFQPIFELHTVKQVSKTHFVFPPSVKAVERFLWVKITVGS